MTSGVLVDIPRIRGIEYLEPGDAVTAEDLIAADPDIESGDALLIRTGRWLAPIVRADTPGSSGNMHGDRGAMGINAMRFVADRDVSVLPTDSVGDTFAAQSPGQPSVRALSLVYRGMPLMHSLNLEGVAQQCADEGCSHFLRSVGALNLVGGTGSPVTANCVL